MIESPRPQSHDEAVATLRAAENDDHLHLAHWSDADWSLLLAATKRHHLSAGETLIRRGNADRDLYLLLRGEVEVMAHSDDGIGFGRVARVGPGSVVGEQAFFDGRPRTAGAWSLDGCEVAGVTPERFAAFAKAHPALACDVLFALGRILALRLERTTARIFG